MKKCMKEEGSICYLIMWSSISNWDENERMSMPYHEVKIGYMREQRATDF